MTMMMPTTTKASKYLDREVLLKDRFIAKLGIPLLYSGQPKQSANHPPSLHFILM